MNHFSSDLYVDKKYDSQLTQHYKLYIVGLQVSILKRLHCARIYHS